MGRFSYTALVLVTLGGCSLEDKPPPVPDGYPQLGEYEEGKAELLIDGEEYVTEYSSGAVYNREGGYEDDLRVRIGLDVIDLTLRDLEEGEFTVASGDLEASYDYGSTANTDCGTGRVEVVGIRSWDRGLLGDAKFMWGTIQLELCDGGEPAAHEISGRFSAIVSES